MKKILTILLASALLAVSFTGCSAKGNTASQETSATEAPRENVRAEEVGEKVGEEVGDEVGEKVGEKVGERVREEAREEVGEESGGGRGHTEASVEKSDVVIKIIDAAGREVIMEKPAEKIVSGYYITTSMLIALGLEDKLVGIEAKAASRPIYRLAAPELLDLTNVGTAKEFNLEGCISLEPDLVILPKRLAEQAETLADMGIATLVVNPENTQLLEETITMIGKAAGVEDRAAELISYYAWALGKLEAIREGKTEKPSVYIAGTGSVLSAATTAMYQNSVIEMAGGVNAARDLTDKGWANLSYEQLIVYNPDIFIIIPEADFTKDDVMKDEQLSGINAVKNGWVYEMPDSFEAWDSPVPSGILGCMWLASIIHEEEYPFETFAEDAADFYEQFYDVEIDMGLITK